jgi:hypothetical protein
VHVRPKDTPNLVGFLPEVTLCTKKTKLTIMNESTQIFLVTSLSLTSVLLGVLGLAVKSQCESFSCCWGALECHRKATKEMTQPHVPVVGKTRVVNEPV